MFPLLCHFISADMARGWMYDLSHTDPRYLTGIDDFIKRARANAGDSHLVFCPCKDCKNTRKWGDVEHIRLHLITRGFMRNYTIWTLHGEVGQNVNDDVPMPSASLNALLPVHDCTEHVPVQFSGVYEEATASRSTNGEQRMRVLCDVGNACLLWRKSRIRRSHGTCASHFNSIVLSYVCAYQYHLVSIYSAKLKATTRY